jgi:hypothetical protein
VGVRTTASVDSPLPGDDDVIRRARIREVSQAVFPASQLGPLVGYIRRPFSAEFSLVKRVSFGSEFRVGSQQ